MLSFGEAGFLRLNFPLLPVSRQTDYKKTKKKPQFNIQHSLGKSLFSLDHCRCELYYQAHSLFTHLYKNIIPRDCQRLVKSQSVTSSGCHSSYPYSNF